MADTQGDGPARPYRKIQLGGYVLPTGKPLSAQEEHELARTIQTGNTALSQLVELLAPSLEAALASVDTSPFDHRDLLGHALAGARRAVERHALSGAADGEFVGRAATMIQQAVAEYIDGSDRRRWDCGGDGGQWATKRLARKIFEDHAARAPAMDPALLEALRARAQAIDILVRAHSRMLASMLAARQGRGQDDPDLLQRGVLALWRAAESFDPDRHPRFNPLARTAITYEFENARREDSGATASACRLIGEFKKAETRLASSPGDPPTESDVFESLGWSTTKRENHRKAVAAAASPDPVEGHPQRRQATNLLQELIAQEKCKRFEAAWGSLGEQAQEILVARFLAEKRETRADLVARLGLTLHQVRRLEEESLETLGRLLGADGPNRPTA
jgi:RNA polymerase sigma factor (sigma-70 family)